MNLKKTKDLVIPNPYMDNFYEDKIPINKYICNFIRSLIFSVDKNEKKFADFIIKILGISFMDDSKIFSIIFKEKLNIKKNFRVKSEDLVSLFSYLYIIFTNNEIFFKNEISMHSYQICWPSEQNILLPAKNLYMGNSFNSDIHINLIDKDIELNINFSYERIKENISKILDNFRINLDSLFSSDNSLKFKEEKFLNQENYKIFLKFTNLNSIENIFCNITKFFTLEKQINTFKWLFNLIFKEKKFNCYKDKIVESLKNSKFLSNKSCENKLPEDLFLMDEISLTKCENIFQNVKNIYFINKNFISGISNTRLSYVN